MIRRNFLKLILATPLAFLFKGKGTDVTETTDTSSQGPFFTYDESGKGYLLDPTTPWAKEAAKDFQKEWDEVLIKAIERTKA
jgi:hypothetical protein